MNVLVITGAIDIQNSDIPYTQLTETKQRLKQYLESLEFAIENYTSITHIIFCDSTNYSFDYTSIVEKARQKNKILEIHSFLGNKEKVVQQGKGYGEGEIMNYLLEHSEVLKKCDYFYKLTGRVVVKNFDAVHHSSADSHFLCYHTIDEEGKSLVSTVFYKISKDLYINKLQSAYREVNDEQGRYLEMVYFQKLKDTDLRSFKTFPIISGISGSTGMRYDISPNRLLIERFLNKIGARDMKLNFWASSILKMIKKIK